MIAATIFCLMLMLLAAGAPVGFAMLISGATGLYWIGGFPMLQGMLETATLSTVNSYELITIPMFLLMAEFVIASGVVDDLFAAAAAWLGRVRGGLGMATAVAGAGFAAICGTSTGSAATLSATTLPGMIKQGYEPQLASGVVAISGTLAVLIPPSVGLVIYGLLADVSIARLLVAGVIPGLLVMLVIMLTVWLLAWQEPTRAPTPALVPLREKIALLPGVVPMICLFGLITGLIYTGITTPTEASACGALGALFLVFWRRKASYVNLRAAVFRAVQTTAMITMILVGAHVFSYFVTLTQVPQQLVSWVGDTGLSPWMVIAMLVVLYIVMGAFMDELGIMVLTIPIVAPLVASLGYDLIWFGILFIVICEVGLVLPPVGMNCFIVARYARMPLGDVYRGVMPHVFAHVLIIALFMAFPQIILWLPSQM